MKFKVLLVLLLILIYFINYNNQIQPTPGNKINKGYFQFTGDTVSFGGITTQECYFNMINNPVVKFYTDGTPMNQISISTTSGCARKESLNITPVWDSANNYFSVEYQNGQYLYITFNNSSSSDQYNAVVSLHIPFGVITKTSQTQATFVATS